MHRGSHSRKGRRTGPAQQPGGGGGGRGNVVKYLCTFGNTIADVLANRGWKEVNEDEMWDFVWADRDWVYSVFDKVHLENWQRLNHYRNGKELCRKDLMAKNIKKKRRALEKEGKYEEAAAYDFIPTTFMLPREYSMFVEKFKEVGGVWIMKPIGSAQGKGIFMFTRLSEISEWRTDFKSLKNGKDDSKDAEAYVVQRYLLHPLLIGRKKFDMRLYCLVTSFSPLRIHVYRRGFARFTNSRYSSDISDIYSHLTNVAIQKTADNYDERTGGKMELQALKMYLMSTYGVERVDALFWEMVMIMIRSLLAVQHCMIHDKHCFELYGYDLIIDEELKPWLLEVNASPSLSANTREDYMMKSEMLSGMLDVVDMEGVLQGDEEHVSGWDLVYDNGFIEIDPTQCGYTTFLGAGVPEAADFADDEEEEEEEEEEEGEGGVGAAGK